ncbi:MAG: type II secretion system protein [bacterium]|nr:type II secretion system protein [bacterium]
MQKSKKIKLEKKLEPTRPNVPSRYGRGTLKLKASAGFSLIELVVAMAIFVTISSVLVVSQRRFGGNTLITNLAYDVALTMRQAQVYGISVRKVKAVSDPEGIAQFNRSYGIHIGTAGYYVLFADANDDKRYNTASNNANGCVSSPVDGSLPECVSFFKIEHGNYIKQFCGDVDCYYGPLTNNAIDRLEILFHRPEPEPTVRGYKGVPLINTYSKASIMVSSPQAVTKSICISATGQMSIKNSC